MTVKKKIPKACYRKLIMKQKLIKLTALKFISYSSKTAKGITDGENLVVSSRGLGSKIYHHQQKQTFLREAI